MALPPTTGRTIDLTGRPEDPHRSDAPELSDHSRTQVTLPRLYGVLDVATLIRLGLARPGAELAPAVAAAAQVLVGAGVRLLQVRGKGLDPVEGLRVAREVVRAAHEASPQALVLINDDPALARRAGADGVHLGASDPSPARARDLLGPDAVVGATVRSADDLPVPEADYLGVGPVRATTTKPGLPEPLGFAGLAIVAAAAGVPVFGIGGLRAVDAAAARAAGAHGVAMVTGLLEGLVTSPDVATRVAQADAAWAARPARSGEDPPDLRTLEARDAERPRSTR